MLLSAPKDFHVSVDSARGRTLIVRATVVHLGRLIGNAMETVTAFTARARCGCSSCVLNAAVHYRTQAPPVRVVVINALRATDEANGLLHGGADVGVVEQRGGVLLQWAVEPIVAGCSVTPVHHNLEDDILVAICCHPAIYLTVTEFCSIRVIRIGGRGAFRSTIAQVATSATDADVADESKFFATQERSRLFAHFVFNTYHG